MTGGICSGTAVTVAKELVLQAFCHWYENCHNGLHASYGLPAVCCLTLYFAEGISGPSG